MATSVSASPADDRVTLSLNDRPGNPTSLALNVTRPPFDEIEVRKAFLLASDARNAGDWMPRNGWASTSRKAAYGRLRVTTAVVSSTTSVPTYGFKYPPAVPDSVPCLVAACWLPSSPPTRIVLAAGYDADAVDADLAATEEFSRRLAKGSGLPLLTSSVGDEADSGTGLEDAGGFASLVIHALATDLLVLSAPHGRGVIGEAAQYLASQRPEVSFIVVQTGAGSRNVEVGDLFAGS